jgi:hypothetical protein
MKSCIMAYPEWLAGRAPFPIYEHLRKAEARECAGVLFDTVVFSANNHSVRINGLAMEVVFEISVYY